MGIDIILTDDAEISEKAFNLRKQVFSKKYNVNFPEENNEYKNDARWLIAMTEDKNIVSTIRLIYDLNSLKNNFKNRVSAHYKLPYEDHKCLEMATVILNPEYSKSPLFFRMLKKVVEFTVEKKLNYICGIVDEDFASMFYQNNEKKGRMYDFKIAEIQTEILGDSFYIPVYGINRIGIGAKVIL